MSEIITDLLNRNLEIHMILDQGQFPGSTSNGTQGGNVKIISADSSFNSLSVEVSIIKASGLQSCSASITIYGLLNEDIDAFTRYNQTNLDVLLQNSVQVYAGYKSDTNTQALPLVYDGQIRMAGPNRNDPSRPLIISSIIGVVNQNEIIAPTNLHGQISIDDLFRSIVAKQDGLIYKPYNVSGITINPNFTGSVIEQLRAATEHFGYKMQIDNPYVLIAPINQPFSSVVYDINMDNGLLGYEQIDEFGISIRVRFNPVIQFGQIINLTTENPLLGGQYFINGLQHTLTNKGRQWESLLKLNRFPSNLQATPAGA